MGLGLRIRGLGFTHARLLDGYYWLLRCCYYPALSICQWSSAAKWLLSLLFLMGGGCRGKKRSSMCLFAVQTTAEEARDDPSTSHWNLSFTKVDTEGAIGISRCCCSSSSSSTATTTTKDISYCGRSKSNDDDYSTTNHYVRGGRGHACRCGHSRS